MSKKVAVFGNGYIGSAFINAGYDFINWRYHPEIHSINELLIQFDQPHMIKNHDVVINCIGYTDTRPTENRSKFQLAYHINADFVRALTWYCSRHNKKLVHISTGDLYGNSFDYNGNVESTTKIDVGTDYRFTKYVGERFCGEDDLILRIRLPFDDRDHPKNLIKKVQNYTKFYHWNNSFTYVPDLIRATQVLVDKDEKGIFNVTQFEATSILYQMRNVLQLQHLMHIDIHDKDHPDLITTLDNVHIHNDMNTEKLRQHMKQTPLEAAWQIAWEGYKKHEKPLAS